MCGGVYILGLEVGGVFYSGRIEVRPLIYYPRFGHAKDGALRITLIYVHHASL